MNLTLPMEGLAMEDDRSGGVPANGETRNAVVTHMPWKHTLDFLIRDINDAIHMDPVVSNSNFDLAVISLVQDDNKCDLIDVAIMEDNPMQYTRSLNINTNKDILNPSAVDLAVGFKVGWADSRLDVRSSKARPKKNSSKGKCTTKPKRSLVEQGVFKRGSCENSPTQGTWKRLPSGTQALSKTAAKDLDVGSKRKLFVANREMAKGVNKEKKQKLLEVFESLCNQLTESLDRRRLQGNPTESIESLKLELSRV